MKHPPQFVEKLQNMGIPERTPVRLECRVVGMPPPVIFWKKDNDSIPKTKDRFRSVTVSVPLIKVQPANVHLHEFLTIYLFQHDPGCHRLCVSSYPTNYKR